MDLMQAVLVEYGITVFCMFQNMNRKLFINSYSYLGLSVLVMDLTMIAMEILMIFLFFHRPTSPEVTKPSILIKF